jgi:two-component system chemotaxis sensor kinase CheA
VTFIGRLTIRTKLGLLAGIPVLGALMLAGVIAQQAQQQAAAAATLGSIEGVAQLSVRITGVIHALQSERARCALLEGRFGANVSSGAVLTDLAEHKSETDVAQRQLDSFLTSHDLSKLPVRLALDLDTARTLAAQRSSFHARTLREDVPVDEILGFYGTINDALINATAALRELSDDGQLLRRISSLVAFLQLTERVSREHALLSYVFASGEFPPGAFKTFVTLMTEQDVYAEAFRASASAGEAQHYDASQRSAAIVRARALRDEAFRATDDQLVIDARSWFANAGEGLSKLHDIERNILSQITRVATQKMQAIHASVRLGFWLSAAVVLASGLLGWVIARGVTRSVFELSSVAAQVRESKDFAIRAKKTSGDELGTLTDTFNEMLATIQARDMHLEAQVAARTEELRNTVAELWSEMDLARKIQMVLLPQEPRLPSYEIAASMVPASTVGGDYYDVFRMDDTDWILVGDVSGHGVTAGLSMMIVQTAVRTVIQSAGSHARALTPKEVLSNVNAAIRDNLQKINPDQYMTIMALQMHGSKVRFSGLHQDILVYRAASKTVERIETRGVWIGLMDDISDLLDDDAFEMADGDILLLYTDGLTEAAVGEEMLGTDGLATAFRQLASANIEPCEIVKQIMTQIGGSTLKDDATILAARYEDHGAMARL